jgi:xanthine/uracil permease
MSGAHILLAFVCIVTVMFVWQIRKETDKWLYFMMGIGAGCAMAALINQ